MNFAKHGYFEVIKWNYEKKNEIISMFFYLKCHRPLK